MFIVNVLLVYFHHPRRRRRCCCYQCHAWNYSYAAIPCYLFRLMFAKDHVIQLFSTSFAAEAT